MAIGKEQGKKKKKPKKLQCQEEGQIIQNYKQGRHRSTDLITSPRSKDTVPSQDWGFITASNKVPQASTRG